MKSNKVSNIGSYIVYTLILIISISLVNFYPEIEGIAKSKKAPSYFDNYDFQRNLYEGSYVLYKDMLEKEQNRSLYGDEIFFKGLNNFYEDNTEEYRFVRDDINFEINEWNTRLKRDFKNLDYYVVSKKNNTIISNEDTNLSQLISNNGNNLNEVNEHYQFYIVIDFDEQGNLNILKSRGISDNSINRFLDFGWTNIFHTSININPSSPSNLTIVYGVPQTLKYTDEISSGIDGSYIYNYSNTISFIDLVLYVLIILLALFIPFNKEKNILLIRKVIKIPFEILISIIGVITALVTFSPNIVYWTINNQLIKESIVDIGVPYKYIDALLYLGNIAYWFLLLITSFTAVVFIKYIFNKGLKNYIKENTIICKILKRIKGFWRKIYTQLINIDLNSKSNKLIIKLLTINFIVLALISTLSFLGIGAHIIYTIFLFFFLRKYFHDIQNKYSVLLKATNKIAEGNLEVDIEEELGVFEPLKGELKKIQTGFKNAVEEEVKSQKMKSELISNVSHDLKTPLTSIITYIDLLKDENISKEDRIKYLDTLDRKSQRLKNLIEDLFEVSKATSKNVQLNIVNVDIVSLMKQTQFELGDKIEESSLKFKWNFPENKIIVPLDSQKTFRVFENLLINIVKYSMPKSRVFIDIIDEESYVYVTLKNMSANEIDFTAEEIVERFARGDKSRNTEGSGLGLAIAKSFVELQGGTLNIEIDGDLFKVVLKFKK
ncbi:sensor histidine kinase [Clostridium sp. AL.422]|uniref:sensor histidine kinase n=1 Tax=Clostridium TaxID=1485 RepID=UPI00293DA60F|nr:MULTISPECIES: sensor histidine kinase [unclassified Clostridium]MDV4150548.1 sensor histidine kinase [Clostridium sp. AL.422]